MYNLLGLLPLDNANELYGTVWDVVGEEKWRHDRKQSGCACVHYKSIDASA